MLFVDLNHFKAVNDAHGHQIGDELLVAVGERLLAVLRPADTLARMSGDEFVILCEDLDDPAQAGAIAARINDALARPFRLSGIKVNMTASIGVAFTGHGTDAPADLIRHADLAMYQTKRKNAGKRQVFDLRELHLAEDHAGLERFLPGAAGRDELHLVYQPIVDAADARLIGVEALLRWTHPRRGEVPPTILIPLAEQSGQIIEIGHWVLQKAWSDRRRWPAKPAREISMSVNVSAHQFMAAGFANSVAHVLSSVSLDAPRLTLEVTESVFVRDGERALVVLKDLKDIGVQIALDDFGTGYSSLSYLMTYPVDTVKVDQTFIASLGENPASRKIVTAVIDLAHSLGMTVVSEGVETVEQHRELAELGCDACQGFYFARPMSATTVDALIRRKGEGNSLTLPNGASAGQ